MQYFKTNFQTLANIAQLSGFDGLAGYLVLARHTTGRQILDYPPHLLSGAGVNSIHEKLGCSEVRAKSIIDTLVQTGFIQPAPSAAQEASPKSSRWILPRQYPLDLDLPHNFVDAPKIAEHAVTSPLRRLKKMTPSKGQDKKEANCDGAMLLLAMYAKNEMQAFGGLPPTSTVYKDWEILSKTPQRGELFEWKAEAKEDMAYSSFIKIALPHAIDEERKNRFWQALNNLKEAGLIYEVISLLSSENKLLASIRVNDFHAGSIVVQNDGDPSLMKLLEAAYNTQFAFFDSKTNPETLKISLPLKDGYFSGIYRLRFRTSNKDTGIWHEEEKERVEHYFDLISSYAEDYDDDF